jgi:hypothetical protein
MVMKSKRTMSKIWLAGVVESDDWFCQVLDKSYNKMRHSYSVDLLRSYRV